MKYKARSPKKRRSTSTRPAASGLLLSASANPTITRRTFLHRTAAASAVTVFGAPLLRTDSLAQNYGGGGSSEKRIRCVGINVATGRQTVETDAGLLNVLTVKAAVETPNPLPHFDTAIGDVANEWNFSGKVTATYQSTLGLQIRSAAVGWKFRVSVADGSILLGNHSNNAGKEPPDGDDKLIRAAWHMQIIYHPNVGKSTIAEVRISGTGACLPRIDNPFDWPVDISGHGAKGGRPADFKYTPDDPLPQILGQSIRCLRRF